MKSLEYWAKRLTGKIVAALPMTEEEKRKHDEALLTKGICPECNPEEPTLLPGPEGGAAQNIMCRVCFNEYNVFFFGGANLIDRMGVASPERRQTVYGISE